MDSIKNFFNKKKLAHKFSKAGPGNKLKDESGAAKSSSKGQMLGSLATPSSTSKPSISTDARKDPARLSAAEAAQRRAQEAQQQNQKATVKMISYKTYPKELEDQKEPEPSASSMLPEKSSTNEVIKAYRLKQFLNLIF